MKDCRRFSLVHEQREREKNIHLCDFFPSPQSNYALWLIKNFQLNAERVEPR